MIRDVFTPDEGNIPVGKEIIVSIKLFDIKYLLTSSSIPLNNTPSATNAITIPSSFIDCKAFMIHNKLAEYLLLKSK